MRAATLYASAKPQTCTQAPTGSALRVTVPIPPSLNNCYTNGKGHGRRVLTGAGRAFKDEVAVRIRLALRRAPMGDMSKARIKLEFCLWFKDRRRRDISNCVKLLEDSLAETLVFDDCHVDDIRVTRAGIDKAHPRCEVLLEVLS